MSTKKLFIGGIVGGIVYYLLDWLVYGKLMTDWFIKHPGITSGYMRSNNAIMSLMLYLVIGNLASGFLLSYVFAKSKVNSLGAGLVAGGIIGFLSSAAFDSIQFATTTLISRQYALADILCFTIISAIAGALVAAFSPKG
jgi:hypothetical protein